MLPMLSNHERYQGEANDSIGFPGNVDMAPPLYIEGEDSIGIQRPYNQPQSSDQSLFEGIRAPGINDVLNVNATQQKYFSASKREQELNTELITCKHQITELQQKVDSLFLENERLKNELELLRKNSSAGNEYNNQEKQNRYWTPTEHKRFLEALNIFGEKNKKAISIYVGTRTVRQIRSHMQKYQERLVNMKLKGKEELTNQPEVIGDKSLDANSKPTTEVLRFVTLLTHLPLSNVNHSNEGYNPFQLITSSNKQIICTQKKEQFPLL